MPSRVTLLTDFGTVDGYVGAMKGVIASIAPEALVEDISHDVPHGDLEAAAWALAAYWARYPIGTIHVVVVDPGVGTERLPLAAWLDGRYVVAPDNGVITRALRAAGEVRLHSLDSEEFRLPTVCATFHGRDVFAPAAAHLACGVALERLGASIEEPVLLELSAAVSSADTVVGRVVHVDRFGNLITDIPVESLSAQAWVELDGTQIGRLVRTYGSVGKGEPLALAGSGGMLEVAVREGSAARLLGRGRGAVVRIREAVQGAGVALPVRE